MSSDQIVNRQPNAYGLAPEPTLANRTRAHTVEQGASGVVDYAALFMAKHGFSASQVKLAVVDQPCNGG